MASYLRPRRGKKATAESQAIVLKKGEVFFEVPTTGVGTGAGKIKMGDGVTAYSSLPYFSEEIPKVEDAVIGFTDSNTETAASNNSTYLTNIKPANSLKTIFTNLKQLLYNYNAEITQLNNDLIWMDQSRLGASNGYLTYTFSGTSRSICRTPHFMLIPCGQSKIFSPITIGFSGQDIYSTILGIFINDDPDNLIVIDQEHLKLKVSIEDLTGWGTTGLINLIPSDKVPYNVTWEAS